MSATALAAASAASVGLVGPGTPAGADDTLTVSSLADSGPGSLRQAILDANSDPDADVIVFASGLSGTITVASDLPQIVNPLDIQGPGASALTVDGQDQFSLFSFDGAGTSKISGITITNGDADNANSDSSGGGVAFYYTSGVLEGVVITSSYAPNDGGGAWCAQDDEGAISLTIRNSVISGNTAEEGGGGVYAFHCSLTVVNSTISGNTAGSSGGGIYFHGSPETLTVLASTISGNTAEDDGGGLYINGHTDYETRVLIANSTISGNSASTGGGIALEDVELDLFQSTVTLNTATASDEVQLEFASLPGGGIRAGNASEKALESGEHAGHGDRVGARAAGDSNVVGSIVSGNSGGDLAGSATFSLTGSLLGTVDPATTVTDQGGNQVGVTDPILGPLQDNGGPTATHALLDGSPAIDAGPATVPAFPGNEDDQRGPGYPRVVNGRVDVGAFEVQPSAVQPIVLEPNFTG